MFKSLSHCCVMEKFLVYISVYQMHAVPQITIEHILTDSPNTIQEQNTI